MPASHNNPSQFLSLKRDPQGRIIERGIHLGGRLNGRLGDSPETRRYTYDSAGRLSRVTDGSGALCESYQYDHQGRRLAEINPLRFRGERRYTYLANNRLGQAGSAQYGHDTAGFRNLKVVGDAETHYHYEPSGLLLAVDLPDNVNGGRRIDYAYDENGLRTAKRVDGRVVEAFRWLDPLRLDEFHDGREWWLFAYSEGRTPVGLTNGRDAYLLLCDQLGTPLALATTDGHVVQAMQYDSFGNLLSVRGNVVRLPLGFAGGLYDADTGLTRFPWRDYDADTGRFTALDPLGKKGGDSDWYGYCVDDPVNRVDAWGLFWDETPGKRIVKSGAIGGITGAYRGFRMGATVGEPVPGAIAGGLVGSGNGMVTQAMLEYPPVKETMEQWDTNAKQWVEDSWNAAVENEGASAEPWPSLYGTTPD